MSDNLTVCLFDFPHHTGFGPLTDLRRAADIRCGAYTFRERMQGQFAVPVYSFVTNALSEAVIIPEPALASGGDLLCLNERLILDPDSVRTMISAPPDTQFTINGLPVALKVPANSANITPFLTSGTADNNRIASLPVTGKLMDYAWDLSRLGGEQIAADYALRSVGDSPSQLNARGDRQYIIAGNVFTYGEPNLGAGVVISAERNPLILEMDVTIGAGAIIDTTGGIVWLDSNATVEPGAIIQGPCYVGSHSIVRPGARLSDGVCLGPHCRVGGEISRTTLLGYSNKQHSGYLGNSYVGEWVNLGAATDNSDLKNNYRPVTVTMNGVEYDTGSLHVGAIIGDFVKTAIHTRLNTGTVIGACCNLFGSDFPPKEIPPFVWVGSDKMEEYRPDKAIATVREVMPRRGRTLDPTLEQNLRSLFSRSADHRARFLQRNG